MGFIGGLIIGAIASGIVGYFVVRNNKKKAVDLINKDVK